MRTRTIVTYALAATIVLILGAFSGWYFFLKTQSQTITGEDAARGYTAPGLGQQSGTSVTPGQSPPTGYGFFSRVLSAITGGGIGVTELSPSSTILPGFTDTSSTQQGAQQQTIGGTSSPPTIERIAQLSRIHSKPVAGMSFTKVQGSERLRYVERSSGYIFDADPETGNVTRFTNTLVPKIYEASFTYGGRIIERSLDDAGNIVTTVTFVATSTKGTASASSTTFSSIKLAPNIERIASDPKTGALFYFVNDARGATGVRTEWNGAKPKSVFSSVISHWNPAWLSDGRIILTQAASDDMLGYAYEMKADGTLSSLVNSIPGLTTLGRPGGALLYGQSSGGALALFVRVKADATVIRLPIRTIADKCVWAGGKDLVAYCGVPQGITPRSFLDDWYRGAAHSSDALWRIDASAGTAEVVYIPDTPIDMENLTVNEAGTHIAFMNATDKSLWLLRIGK